MNIRPNLDFLEPPIIGAWLPNETVFSLASRHHQVSCNRLASDTCRQLFGHPKQGSQHDLPCRIDTFVTRTGGRLGDAEHIIREHSLLPFYLPLRPPQAAADAIATMRAEGIGTLKYRLGLLTSRFRAHHPLKACPQCMVEDRDQYSVAYWHLEHQYPGVWLCTRHQALLLECDRKANGVNRFLWELPRRQHLIPLAIGEETTSQDRGLSDKLLALGEAAVLLARCPPGFTFHPDVLHATYIAALQRQGFRVHGERIRKVDVAAAFAAYCIDLRQIPELIALPANTHEADCHLGRLFSSRSLTHPLRHLTFITWLFHTWANFQAAYERTSKLGHGYAITTPTPIEPPRIATKASHVQIASSLIAEQGLSARRAAQVASVDTNTMLAWAAQAGIRMARRPKVLKDSLREAAINALRAGADKLDVAHRNNISISTVNTLLLTEAGLHEQWRQARFDTAQRRAREKWIETCSDNPSLGIKAVRLLEPATYAWLYRNDRAWLDQQKIGLPKAIPSNHVHIDWDRRDADFAQAIREAALAIVSANPDIQRITTQMLYQHLPSLRAKLSQLQRLPLTYKALQLITRRQKNA